MIGWLSSKMSVLLFAIVVFTAVFGISNVLKNFYSLDSNFQEAYNLARAVDSACSAPFNIETNVSLSSAKSIASGQVSNNYFVSLSGMQRAVHCTLLNSSFTASKVIVRKTNGVINIFPG